MKKNQHQIGVIVFGNGLDLRYWLQDALSQGIRLVFRKGYAEMWR